jgi:hypothetical protein
LWSFAAAFSVFVDCLSLLTILKVDSRAGTMIGPLSLCGHAPAAHAARERLNERVVTSAALSRCLRL